ncbi:MAG TPA: hypothetical protein VN643_12250 [Pyrinomonadaceae bacterium]|nr:hypothetical protein [Pyrinomonadaceae bacterium]
MSVKEGSATALIRFTGLGIICFNKDLGRGEFGAIRDHKHTLTIRIQRPEYQEGGDKDVVAYRDIATYQNLPKDDVQIEIKAAGGAAIPGYEIYQNGDFDRLDSADVNDFRWIVSLNSLHGDTPLTVTGEKRHPLTKFYIGNGLFYTHKLDTNIFFEKVQANPNGDGAQREEFGNVAETMGVKIEAEAVDFTIRIAGKEESHTLRRLERLPYRIEIMNMDHSANAVSSDMPDYYGYLSHPSQQQFDLSPVVEAVEGKGGSGFNMREFCHPVMTDDLSSIDQL